MQAGKHGFQNDLKTKGVAAIEAMLEEHSEAIISVRGKDHFFVMDIVHYHYLRECELEAALAESQADLAAGRYLKTLQLLELNPHHPSLRLDRLSGKLEALHSVSIKLCCRVTLELLIHDDQIVPVNVGDHDAVY